MATPHDVLPAPQRRPARDLIEAVLENMRQNLEPLKYSTLAPSRYLVYVHATEFTRLQGILGIVQAQTIRALDEELATLNRSSTIGRLTSRFTSGVLGRPAVATVENAAPEWHVEFLIDPDGDLQPGDVLVDSELLLPAGPELGAGNRTRRITTVHVGSRVTVRDPVTTVQPAAPAASTAAATAPTRAVAPPPPTAPLPTPSHAVARIAYEDDAGPHVVDVVKASVSIGRGGVAYPVDVRIASSPDVSREHARIRHDAGSGRFFLIDLSSLGTTLDGEAVPRGYDDTGGGKRENGVEVEIGERARIGLAGLVFLDFTAVR